MTGILAIFLLVVISGIAGLTGLVLLGVGWLKGRRRPKWVGLALMVGAVVGVTGGVAYSSLKGIRWVRGLTLRGVWGAAVDAAFDDTGVRALAPAEARKRLGELLTKASVLDDVEVQGVWVPGAFLSYGYFTYTMDERPLLDAVASAPTITTFQVPSDAVCREVGWEECRRQLLYPKGPWRNLPDWAPDVVTERRCYQCFRSPWQHTLLVDGRTHRVYHAISEVRE